MIAISDPDVREDGPKPAIDGRRTDDGSRSSTTEVVRRAVNRWAGVYEQRRDAFKDLINHHVENMDPVPDSPHRHRSLERATLFALDPVTTRLGQVVWTVSLRSSEELNVG